MCPFPLTSVAIFTTPVPEKSTTSPERGRGTLVSFGLQAVYSQRSLKRRRDDLGYPKSRAAYDKS